MKQSSEFLSPLPPYDNTPNRTEQFELVDRAPRPPRADDRSDHGAAAAACWRELQPLQQKRSVGTVRGRRSPGTLLSPWFLLMLRSPMRFPPAPLLPWTRLCDEQTRLFSRYRYIGNHCAPCHWSHYRLDHCQHQVLTLGKSYLMLLSLESFRSNNNKLYPSPNVGQRLQHEYTVWRSETVGTEFGSLPLHVFYLHRRVQGLPSVTRYFRYSTGSLSRWCALGTRKSSSIVALDAIALSASSFSRTT